MRFKRAGAVRDERPAAVDTVGDGGVRFLNLSAVTHDIHGACSPPCPTEFVKDPGTDVGRYDQVLIPRRSVGTDGAGDAPGLPGHTSLRPGES